MYNISEMIVVMASLFVAYNSWISIDILIRRFPKAFKKMNEQISFLIETYNFICEHNPLILDFYETEKEQPELKVQDVVECKIEAKYENKYLEKFKQFPNEFSFTEVELEQETQEYEKIRLNYEKSRLDTINEIQEKLFKINEIQETGNIVNKDEKYTENINEIGIIGLLKFFDIEEEYNDDSDDFDIEELYLDLLKNKEELLQKMSETEKMNMADEEMRKLARQIIINQKLDKFIDNYVLERTPLGNIYMRYNHNKGSFEYFSNNTIPYRYLEPVARKYVTTFWCKPIFIDIDEELKNAETRYDEEKKKKEEDNIRRQEDTKNNVKSVITKMKSYNKDTKNQAATKPMKNRSTNNILPPQIKATLPNITQTSEKQLLKENANRYTWEGRLTGFCPLKKIDKKILDKKLAMTYADFKRMQNK